MKFKIIYLCWGLLLSVVFSYTADAQDYVDWKRAERFTADSLSGHYRSTGVSANWIEGTRYFYYFIEKNGARDCYLVNASNGKRKLLFDNEKLASEVSRLTGKEYKPEDLKLYRLDFYNKDLSCFYIKKEGKDIKYTISSGTGKVVSERPDAIKKKNAGTSFSFGKGKRPWAKYSADSVYIIYGRNHNLFLSRNGNTLDDWQLTTDGEPYNSYTSNNSEKRDTACAYTCARWIDDTHMIFAFREDKRSIETMTLVNSLSNPRPLADTYKMPMPGDSGVSQYDIQLFDAETRKKIVVPIAKYPDQKVVLSYADVPGYVYMTRRSRPADYIDLCRINTRTGEVEELISDHCVPHMNVQLFNYQLINKGKEILWWSERNGKGQYFLYDENGRLKNAITPADMVAGQIVHLDTLGRTMIVEGYGKEKGINPYYRFFYKVDLDGSHFTLLTPGDGTHSIELSPDKKYLIDNYSRMDMPVVSQLVKIASPKKPMVIEQSDDSELRALGWRPPVLFSMKAADDSTDLYGIMYLPFDLDTACRYPIITNVYPGPQDDQIPRAFTVDDNYNQSLAQLGFVVINVGARGSSQLRGRDFHCFGYGNLRDYPLADDKHVIEELARRYRFIDIERVGIYGHSGGGFQTVAAMLTYPDFYKVGIAASGNHDNNLYIQWWGETYHGVQSRVDSITGKTVFSCKIPTNNELADRLKGRLMLITGDVDKNVHPSTTFRLAKALMEADKRFDMMIMPGMDHGVGNDYYYNLIRYYFVEHLLNPKREHIDIIHHK